MKKRVIRTLIVITAMSFSFVLASFVNQELFLADSPQLRPNLDSHIVKRWNDVTKGNLSAIASAFQPGNEPDREPMVARNDDRDDTSDAALESDSESDPNRPTDPRINTEDRIADDSEDDILMEQVTTGVYAGENEDTKRVIIRQDEVEWQQKSITVDGVTYQIEYIPDQEEPDDDLLRQLLPID